MRPYLICAGVLVLVGLAGYAVTLAWVDPLPRNSAPAPLAPAPNPSNPNSLVVQKLVPKVIQPGVPFSPDTVDDIYRFQYVQDKYDWTAYVGSNPGASATEKFAATFKPTPDPTMQISIGWLFVFGRFPIGQAGDTVAGAEGTAMIVQHEGPANAGTVRVFFVGKDWHSDEVKVRYAGTLKATLSKVGDFVELDAGGNATPGSIDDDANRKKIVDDIMAKLKAVGVEP
jgi:hypothetical protein